MSGIAAPVSESPFLAVGDGLVFLDHAAGDGPIKRDTHDQDQPFQAVILEMNGDSYRLKQSRRRQRGTRSADTAGSPSEG